jgi:hypothetical protein
MVSLFGLIVSCSQQQVHVYYIIEREVLS